MRAVALLSGGLDSTLAIRVMQEQGVEVHALNFTSLFCNCTPKTRCCSAAATACRQLGAPLKVLNVSDDILEIVKHPRHGYGRNLNPCLDCRILKFRKARDYMDEIGASFLITGEVLGQRPMSQRRDAMVLIERESGAQGLIVRPLSARVLPPSLPEINGWIDRQMLLNISGRSRKPQIALARDYGITDYPCPAGGCLLTDAGFAGRMRELMSFDPDFTVGDVLLLKAGRHFRLSDRAKAVVGRDEVENRRLRDIARADDTLLEAVNVTGPLTLVRGITEEDDLDLAAAITACYGKGRRLDRVTVRMQRGGEESLLSAVPARKDRVSTLVISG